MSDPVLHIKDSYYFEIPKPLAPAHFEGKNFPNVWVKNDEQFQGWEAHRLYQRLEEAVGHDLHLPQESELIEHWHDWQHDGANHVNAGRPLDIYIELLAAKYGAEYKA